MNDFEKGRFQKILQNTYNNNLKELNDALEKHTQHIDNKKEANKNAYVKYREDDDFKQKKSQYDKQYYQDNKHRLLQSKKRNSGCRSWGHGSLCRKSECKLFVKRFKKYF